MRDEKKKKRKKWPIILVILIVLFLLIPTDEEVSDDGVEYYENEEDYLSDNYDSYCQDGYCSNDYDLEDEDYYDYEYTNTEINERYPLGTCGELNGTTLVLSIFVGDNTIGWSEAEDGLKRDSLKYLKMGTDWISSSAAQYGCNTNFICDWTKNSDLYYECTLDCDLMDLDYGWVDEASWMYIDDSIDVDGLMKKYSADNILFVYLINPPQNNPDTSATRNHFEGMEFPYECCYMYMYTQYEKETPAGFAHEILHAFGAPDLYMADSYGDNYGITQEFVDMCWETQCNDIMFTTYGNETGLNYYDRITNDFTELDAYYVGITNHSSIVSEWGFDSSEHS